MACYIFVADLALNQFFSIRIVCVLLSDFWWHLFVTIVMGCTVMKVGCVFVNVYGLNRKEIPSIE